MYMIFWGKELRDMVLCRIVKLRKFFVMMEICFIFYVWWIDGCVWESDGNDCGLLVIIV